MAAGWRGSLERWWPTGAELATGTVLFVVFALVSLLATGFILVRLPADYFAGPSPPDFWHGRPPAVRIVGRILRNGLGACLVVVGIFLSLPGIPGQGLLTILIGLMMLDVPGKRKWEQRLVRRPKVLAFINGLRQRYGRPELTFDPDERPVQAG